jgi:hypothetical protein
MDIADELGLTLNNVLLKPLPGNERLDVPREISALSGPIVLQGAPPLHRHYRFR